MPVGSVGSVSDGADRRRMGAATSASSAYRVRDLTWKILTAWMLFFLDFLAIHARYADPRAQGYAQRVYVSS